jgi:hypothetical protein
VSFVDIKDSPLTDIGGLPMSVRGESLKSTKDTYVCERRIFNIDQGHLCPYVSLVDINDSPLTDIGVLGRF